MVAGLLLITQIRDETEKVNCSLGNNLEKPTKKFGQDEND